MPAYVICHLQRRTPPGGRTGREVIDEKVSELWQGRLQLDGSWIIHADKTSDQIRDILTQSLPAGDGLLVIGTGTDAAWAGFENVEADWLVDHI